MTASEVKDLQCYLNERSLLSKCITNMNTSSPLKRILNNLTIQIIFEYFMDIYNKLFPYGNIHPTFVLYVLLSKQTDIQTHTFQI